MKLFKIACLSRSLYLGNKYYLNFDENIVFHKLKNKESANGVSLVDRLLGHPVLLVRPVRHLGPLTTKNQLDFIPDMILTMSRNHEIVRFYWSGPDAKSSARDVQQDMERTLRRKIEQMITRF